MITQAHDNSIPYTIYNITPCTQTQTTHNKAGSEVRGSEDTRVIRRACGKRYCVLMVACLVSM